MKPSDWPLLPREIGGLAGPIAIRRGITEAEEAMGLWECEVRRIRVARSLSREVAISTLLHELTHAALHDAGLIVEDVKQEQLCDTIASAMMHVVRWSLEEGRKPIPFSHRPVSSREQPPP